MGAPPAGFLRPPLKPEGSVAAVVYQCTLCRWLGRFDALLEWCCFLITIARLPLDLTPACPFFLFLPHP